VYQKFVLKVERLEKCLLGGKGRARSMVECVAVWKNGDLDINKT
jgi:hypothetical protein